MLYIDVAMAIVGLLFLAWPRMGLLGAAAAADASKVRFVRLAGAGMLVIGAYRLAMRLAGV